MSKGKYNPEIVDVICNTIALTGTDKEGIKAGGISKNTFYKWLKLKSDFYDRVARAKEKFRRRVLSHDHELFMMAYNGLLVHLSGPIEKWNHKIKYSDGKVETKETIVKRPPSSWAIKAILFIVQNNSVTPITELDTDALIRAMNMVTDMPMD